MNRVSSRGLRIAWAMMIVGLPWIAAHADSRAEVVVVVGADGSEEYGKQFREWAGRWSVAAKQGGAIMHTIGLDNAGEATDHDRLRQRLADSAGDQSTPLWLILIGHGTFDGKVARFNLRGPDVTANELAEWLKPMKRPLAVINCASSSGAFLNVVSAPNRVVITATKSGHEYNFARFGDYLSAAINDPQADLDKDEQTSLLEAFLLAASRVRDFYDRDGRLATEHALLDDSGDQLGTPADWFRGLRATKSAKSGAAIDGAQAARWHLVPGSRESRLADAVRTRRDELEQQLATLRQRKTELTEADYLQKLEPILVELAKLYETADDDKPASAGRAR